MQNFLGLFKILRKRSKKKCYRKLDPENRFSQGLGLFWQNQFIAITFKGAFSELYFPIWNKHEIVDCFISIVAYFEKKKFAFIKDFCIFSKWKYEMCNTEAGKNKKCIFIF
jgi:hypothetical protein